MVNSIVIGCILTEQQQQHSFDVLTRNIFIFICFQRVRCCTSTFFTRCFNILYICRLFITVIATFRWIFQNKKKNDNISSNWNATHSVAPCPDVSRIYPFGTYVRNSYDYREPYVVQNHLKVFVWSLIN